MDIGILVPVTRNWCAETFVRNTNAPIYAMVNEDCTDWSNIATIIDGPETTWATRLNRLFNETDHEWLLLVGEDVIFHEGWQDALIPFMEQGCKVIGTNDLLFSTPHYIDWVGARYSGHSPHPVVNRNHVMTHGLTFDGGPGTLFYEYKHLFADTEMMQVAHRQGVWGYSEECIIEHIGDRDTDYNQTFVGSEAETIKYLRRLKRFRSKKL